MDKQYNEFVGVDNVHFAIVTTDTAESYVAETPEMLAPVADISNETETSSTTTYYDNAPSNNYTSEGATKVSLTVSGVPAQLAAKLMGKHFDSEKGVVYDDGKPNPPNIALSFRLNKGLDEFRYYQYLKGKFTGGNEEASSITDSIDAKTYKLIYTAVITTHKWNVNNESKGLKRIFADTTDTNFIQGSSWFNAVQTPDTISPVES